MTAPGEFYMDKPKVLDAVRGLEGVAAKFAAGWGPPTARVDAALAGIDWSEKYAAMVRRWFAAAEEAMRESGTSVPEGYLGLAERCSRDVDTSVGMDQEAAQEAARQAQQVRQV